MEAWEKWYLIGLQNRLLQFKEKRTRTYWFFPTPRIHCARWVRYGSACEWLLKIVPRLWISALNSFSNLLQQRIEWECQRGPCIVYRQHCIFCPSSILTGQNWSPLHFSSLILKPEIGLPISVTSDLLTFGSYLVFHETVGCLQKTISATEWLQHIVHTIASTSPLSAS